MEGRPMQTEAERGKGETSTEAIRSASTRRRAFSARYRHRLWALLLIILGSLTALPSAGFFIGSIASGDAYYVPSAITFLIPTLALLLPGVYLARGRDTDPRPAARRANADAKREALAAERASDRAARTAEVAARRQTAEADRDAAVAQRAAAQADQLAAEARQAAITAGAALSHREWIESRPDLDGVATSPIDAPTSLIVDRIARYVRVSGLLWFAFGVIQIVAGVGFAFAAGLTLTLVICGIWNVVAATSRLNSVMLIKARDNKVPRDWEGIAGLLVVGVVNLLIGGVIGVVFVVFDFVVRSLILRHRALFNATAPQ
jgi:hypothetical protein